MSAEAEVTDIIVRVSMNGLEQFLRITGSSAEKALAFLFATLKSMTERQMGKQKLGGKIKTRAFVEKFVASSVFQISKEDLKKLSPEMKRLHIPYMSYKSTKEMKSDGNVEISVPREDVERFMRIAEKLSITSVQAYDFKAEELSQADYEKFMSEATSKGVEISASEKGVSLNTATNPIAAPADHSPRSEQNSRTSNSISEDLIFKPNGGINKQFEEARKQAARMSGELIPIAINKETLLEEIKDDGIIVTVPRTNRQEKMFIPRADITDMNADNGKTIRVDLKAVQEYQIQDKNGTKRISGREIEQGKKWRSSNSKWQKPSKIKSSPTLSKGGR